MVVAVVMVVVVVAAVMVVPLWACRTGVEPVPSREGRGQRGNAMEVIPSSVAGGFREEAEGACGSRQVGVHGGGN